MKNANSQISVIIPSRNRRSYLLDLLDDLARQTLPPTEIIVVDQSDEPYHLTGCKVLRDDGRGPARARNKAIEAAQGDILVFLDDDTRIEPDFLANLCQSILAGAVSAACGRITNAEGKVYSANTQYWRNNHTWWIAALTANPNSGTPALTLSFPTGCAAVRAEIIRAVGGFDTFFDPSGAGEDREMALRLFHNNCSVHYIPSASIRHIGAPTGGRRDPIPDLLSHQDKNYLYIVAKYFGKAVYESACRDWLYALTHQNRAWNLRARLYDLRLAAEARRYIRRLDQLILNNDWREP